MTKTQIRNIITKIHFYLLGFALLNFALKSMIEISLNYRLAYFITLLVYTSGIILFIWNFKSFKKIVFYYGFYVISPILTLLFWFFGGILLAILTSLVIFPIYPNQIEFESDKIVVYTKYQGFMGVCCPYEVNEKKLWLFEKRITEINLYDEIDFDSLLINSKKEKLELKIKLNEHNYETRKNETKDTIIAIKVE